MDTRNTLLGKFGPEYQNCQFKLKFGTKTNSIEYEELNDDVQVFPFWLETPFLGKFGPKNQIVRLSWNLVSRLIRRCRIQCWCSPFLLLTGNTFLGQTLVQKMKTVSLNKNLVSRLIPICRIQCWCSLFSVLVEKHPFWVNLVQKLKVVSLSWNMVSRPIRICRVQWCCTLSVIDRKHPFPTVSETIRE